MPDVEYKCAISNLPCTAIYCAFDHTWSVCELARASLDFLAGSGGTIESQERSDSWQGMHRPQIL